MHIGPTKRDPMLGSGERPRSTSIGLTRCRTSGSQSRQLGDSARRDAALLSARTRTTANAPEPSHSSARSRLDGTLALALATSESRRSRQLDVDRVIAFAAAGRRTCCRAAFAMPRPQSSRGGRRTAASARRCTAEPLEAAGIRGAIASMPHRPGSPGPKRSSRRRRPRDRFARYGIVLELRPRRLLLLSDPAFARYCKGDQAHVRHDAPLAPFSALRKG